MIYGAINKTGMCFAYYLMAKGFNLILIERDGVSLQKLEDQLRSLLPSSNASIVRVVLNKFDQDSVNRAVGDYVTYPVKVFVNCKSSKRSVQPKKIEPAEYEERKRAILSMSIRESQMPPNDQEIRQILESEDRIQNLDLCTTAEVLFTG